MSAGARTRAMTSAGAVAGSVGGRRYIWQDDLINAIRIDDETTSAVDLGSAGHIGFTYQFPAGVPVLVAQIQTPEPLSPAGGSVAAQRLVEPLTADLSDLSDFQSDILEAVLRHAVARLENVRVLKQFGLGTARSQEQP